MAAALIKTGLVRHDAVHRDTHPGKASITFLPMIDMNPNDMSCVYSTLRLVATECKRHQVTPILMFDQPLWWKGQLIIANEPAGGDLHELVLRLGGFHAEMSFRGCIFSVMAASGLEELVGVEFAPNTVKHVLSGKPLARAIRGHILVDSTSTELYSECNNHRTYIPCCHSIRSSQWRTEKHGRPGQREYQWEGAV